MFGIGSFYFAGSFEKIVEFLQYNIHPHVFLTLKGLLSLALVYHTLNGVRHLFWDTGRGLKLTLLYKTGYILIPLTILCAIALTVSQ